MVLSWNNLHKEITLSDDISFWMVRVFSFCLYGNKVKYCRGMSENLKLIAEKYPDFETWIYFSEDVPDQYLQEYRQYKTQLIPMDHLGHHPMIYRYFPIDQPQVELMFVRDADSRINQRDQWCIDQFIQSDATFHIIRDHYFHKKWKITGAMWGIKRSGLTPDLLVFNLYHKYLETINTSDLQSVYGEDEKFLNLYLFPKVCGHTLIHSDLIQFEHEEVTPISSPLTQTNFIGNVHDFDPNGLESPVYQYHQILYDHIREHLEWLVNQKAWLMIGKIWMDLQSRLVQFTASQRYSILDYTFLAKYYLGQYDECRNLYQYYQNTHVDEHVITNSNYLINSLKKSGMKLIGTTNLQREPCDNEIVIIYGNYHHSLDNLPWKNKIYRHAIYVHDLLHDDFEFHPCWKQIDRIYIFNLEERRDRLMEIMVELTRIDAPLHRVVIYKAKKEKYTDNLNTNSNVGALDNHLYAVRDFLKLNGQHCLILEDDVTFTSNIYQHQRDMITFFERHYDYDVCLLNSSKYHEIRPFDDLLSRSFQACTTTSGYILSKQGANKILPLFIESREKMIKTHDTSTYAVDRYWSKIQKDDKFYLMKRKFGYQRCNYSSITNIISCHFD